MIWNAALECLPRAELERLQGKRLSRVVASVHERVAFYRNQLDQRGIQPTHIKGIADLESLPFTRKSDLRDHYPYGLLARPLGEIVRLHASSGTTGKPIIVAYTRG